jgi:predicted acyl esterase
MARTPTPLHYYDHGSGRFNKTSTYPFTGSSPTRLYFGAGGTLTSSAPPAGASSSLPLPGPLGTLIGAAPSLPGASDSIVWSPTGTPCGRPIDQWSMGGISVPAGTAGFLAPCASDDQASQSGPWATTYTTAPLARPHTVAGPITATIYASSTTSETQLVAELEEVTPSGASYPLSEGALLGFLRAVNQSRSWTAGGVMVLSYHPFAGVGQAGQPGRRHRVQDPDLPDARDDRRRRPPAVDALDYRHAAPDAAA